MTETNKFHGSCDCGKVQYEVTGPLDDVIYCHCSQCRKTSGHFVAATRVPMDNLNISENEGLCWYQSSEIAQRGFCGNCGSSMFWKPGNGEHISIMAGSFDNETGLRGGEHIYVASAGDYYALEDGLPKHETVPE